MNEKSEDYGRCLAVLKHAPHFSSVPDDDIRSLLDLLCWETWDKRTAALSRDLLHSRFRILISGRIKLTRCHPDSAREITLFLLGPGDAYDVSHLLVGKHYEVTATPLDNLDILSAPVKEIRDWVNQHPQFKLALHRYMSELMSQLMDLAADLSLYDTETRLARLILRHANRAEGRSHMIQDLSHEELASLIGSVRVVVNRVLQDLKHKGIVDARRGRLEVRDLDALEDEIEKRMFGIHSPLNWHKPQLA